MKLCGIDINKCIYDRKWYYFPHVFEKDYPTAGMIKSKVCKVSSIPVMPTKSLASAIWKK